MSLKLRGFSLIEVIISGALVATTVGALFTLASMATRLTIIGQDRLVASQLAREGIEVVRQIRDANFVSDVCQPGTYTCNTWYAGLATSLENLPVVRGIDTNIQTGFKLYSDFSGSSDLECTDYLIRNISTGEIQLESHSYGFRPTSGEQLFCRRIFLEPLSDISMPNSELNEGERGIRIRSQVAWLGQGRNRLRTFPADSLTATNNCQREGTEWCTEQVTILTDWRPHL